MKKSVNFLLVEDNELDAEKIERTFRKLSISNKIYRAQNGLEALDYLREVNGKEITKPRVVLLDLNMPKMNGLEFLEELRNDDQLKKTPVFVLTTSDHKPDVEKAYELNVQGYIVKPFNREEFVKTLSGLKVYWELMEHPENGLEH